MTKYFTQFDESTQTIGTDLAGWTVEVGGTPGRAPAYGAATTVPVKRRYLALTTQTAGTNTMLSWDAIDADANRDKFDLLTCAILPLTTVDDNVALFARQSSGINNVYFGILTLAGGLSIYKVVAGVGTTVASAGFTVDPAKSYFLRFNGNGTALKLKAWDAALGMAGEPTTWNISTTDSSLTAAGNVGLQCYDAAGTGEVAAFNFLAVGTNGDTAPCPRTNTEYTAWLDKQDVIRCVLAEMSATGYDSGGSPYTKTVNVYLSNHGYTSQQQDTPSLKHYDNYIQQIPTFTREMSTALSGQATTGFGDLIISNPVNTLASGGVRDSWLRMRWNRNYLKLYLGDPSWPKHDFRLMIYGRLGMPSAPTLGQIKFPIADLSDALNVNISTNRYTSGEFIDKYKPRLFGLVRAIEVQFDSATLLGTLNDGALVSTVNDATYRLHDCTSSAFVHIGGTKNLTISAVNTATETMTASAAHNMSAGYRIQFTTGSQPGGISTATNYWVLAAGLTATDFRVTATQGSLTPVNLTTATTGSGFNSFGYTFDATAGTVTLINPPAGRVFSFNVNDSVSSYTSLVIANIAFTQLALSLNFKDAASFTAAAAVDVTDGSNVGIATRIGEIVTGASLVQRIATGMRAWFGFTADGLMQTGSLSLPTSSAVMSFTEADVVAGSLRLVDVLRPVNYARANINYAPWFSVGAQPIVPNVQLTSGYDFGIYSAEIAAGLNTRAAASYGAAGVPIDDHPDQIDANTVEDIDSLSLGGSDMDTRAVALRKQTLGIFEFTTRLSALQLNIGDTISLTHSRYEWKQYTGSDDASPDNTGTVEARYAVVIGIETNVGAGTTKIKCFRRIPGYYPTADLN